MLLYFNNESIICMHVKLLQNIVEKVLPVNLGLFMLRPITLKQLNSSTLIHTFGGPEVTLQCGARGPAFDSRFFSVIVVFLCFCLFFNYTKSCNVIHLLYSTKISHLFEGVVKVVHFMPIII